MKMIRFRSQLTSYLEDINYNKTEYRIAVEALIFTKEGRIILELRGKKARDEVGKLEGVGGGIGNHNDLHQVLQERINGELGPEIQVKTERLLEVRVVKFEDRDKGPLDWVVVSYLCRVVDGKPMIGEPDMVDALYELTLDDLYTKDESQLSRSVIIGRETYKAKYGNRPYYETPQD